MKEYNTVPMPRNKNVQRFNVHLTEEFDHQVVRIQARREKSPAFDYGNQTCVIIDYYEPDGRQRNEMIDTRYVGKCGSPEGFEEWIGEYIKKMYGDNAELIEQF